MENAIWLSTIFGPFLTILGLWMLLYSENFVKTALSIKSSPGCFYLLGVFNLLIGLSVLSQFSVWQPNLSFFLTLFGWVMMVRGVLIFFMPQAVIRATMGKHKAMKYLGFVPLVWGILLCWLAFGSPS